MKRRHILWFALVPAVLVVLAVAHTAGFLPSLFPGGHPGARSTPPASTSPQTVQVVWTFEPPQRGAVFSSPLVEGDSVYAAAIRDGLVFRGAVYRLARDTGRVVWSFDDDGRMLQMFSSPCLAGGRLYVGEGMHQNFTCRLYCLDAATGRKCWHFEASGHIESSPCVASGRVYFGAGDDGLYCLDAASGKEIWHFHGPLHIDASPAVVGQHVYAGSGVSLSHRRTEVFCLDSHTGKVVWRVPTDLPAWGSPAVFGKHVFFGLGNGRFQEPPRAPERPAGAVLCMAAATGEQAWRYQAGEAVFCRVAVEEQLVCFGARDGCCYALDRRSGQLRWKTDLGSPVIGRPALAGPHVWAVSSGGRVARLDARTGALEATLDLATVAHVQPRVFSSPTILADPDGGSRIYFGAELAAPGSTSAAVVYCLHDGGPHEAHRVD
jgi:outer membrane protein assembly factor BamB